MVARVKVAPTDDQADQANPAVAEAEALLRQRPEGMPGVFPLHALPRRQRATVELLLADSVDELEELRKAQEGLDLKTDQAGALRLHARTQNAVQSVADALAGGATDAAAFHAWADKQDEATILQGFAWYMGTLQPGEAAGSQ